MPYTITQARKSQYYTNIQDADEQKFLKEIETNKQEYAISGSAIDAVQQVRDEDGFLLSYEDPKNPGVSIEEPYQYVRLQVVQRSADRVRFQEFFGNDGSEKSVFKQLINETADETGINPATSNKVIQDIIDTADEIEEEIVIESLPSAEDVEIDFSDVEIDLSDIQAEIPILGENVSIPLSELADTNLPQIDFSQLGSFGNILGSGGLSLSSQLENIIGSYRN